MTSVSTRVVVSGVEALVEVGVAVVSMMESRRLLFRGREEVEGGGPCGRVNIVRNQAEVILSVVEGTRKRTPSRELRTTSALNENKG
jgi:hypothetical protein